MIRIKVYFRPDVSEAFKPEQEKALLWTIFQTTYAYTAYYSRGVNPPLVESDRGVGAQTVGIHIRFSRIPKGEIFEEVFDKLAAVLEEDIKHQGWIPTYADSFVIIGYYKDRVRRREFTRQNPPQ
jgi:hypothetical protein